MRKRKTSVPVHGWLVLDKPLGLTSTQALGKARRYMDGNKVGHGGTLDPLATGILPLAFGEATKLIPYIVEDDKEYEFTVRFGEQRDTDDAEGKVLAQTDKRPTEAEIKNALSGFIGVIQQTPPAFSAIKLEGQRAYDIARSGGKPEIASREVEIFDLNFIDMPDRGSARFKTHCGKGMYVRSLARDLSLKLGTYGYVSALRRTRVGPFTLERAFSLEKLQELSHNNAALTALLAIREALDDIPGLDLTASEAQRLRAGQSILIRPQHGDLMEAETIFAEHQGVPVALVTAKAGEFRVMRGFHF
ncbi:MAG: tRNA pseudouridine(55) synthase TruB [Alphaproteobacteria bacterium]